MKCFLSLFVFSLLHPSLGQTQEEPPEKKKIAPEEIVRGFYTKADLGYLIFLGLVQHEAGTVGQEAEPGTFLSMGFGYDMVQGDRIDVAAELSFIQGINNGNPNSPVIQGDFRSYWGTGGVKLSFNPIVRLSFYLTALGGVFYSQLEREEDGTFVSGLHGSVKPFGGVALGLVEYFTKLAHFSLAIESSFYYVVGFDAALGIHPSVKYTF